MLESAPGTGNATPQMVAWPGQEFGLSEREAKVIRLICDGLTNEAIRETLYLSINSIMTYIRTAYRNIGVTRRSDALLWGVDHGMRTSATSD